MKVALDAKYGTVTIGDEVFDSIEALDAAILTQTEAVKWMREFIPPPEDETEVKRREIARPALQAVINFAGVEAGRRFLNACGYSGIKRIPLEEIEPFANRCFEELARLNSVGGEVQS